MGHAGLRGGGIQYDLVLVPLVLNDNTIQNIFYFMDHPGIRYMPKPMDGKFVF